MKYALIGLAMLAVGCGGSSPTSPTPPPIIANPGATIPPVVTTPPVVTPPVVVTPPTTAPAFPPNDPRFDMTFYRMFAYDAYDSPSFPVTLFRQRVAPRIYLRTVHQNGSAIDAFTLDQTAAALINTAGSLTGVFGLAGLERGTGTKAGEPGWITVSWRDDPERRYCGYAGIGADWIDLYTNTPGCRCAGGPAVRLVTVKHELGHALGFYHTDSRNDLMFTGDNACDKTPSAREIYHASVAYTQPIGSRRP